MAKKTAKRTPKKKPARPKTTSTAADLKRNDPEYQKEDSTYRIAFFAVVGILILLIILVLFYRGT